MTAKLRALVLALLTVAGTTVLGVAAVGASAAQTAGNDGGATAFDYESAPAADANVTIGDEYVHDVRVETNASDGLAEVVLYYKQSANIDYESATAELNGTALTLDADTSSVDTESGTYTRVTISNRSLPAAGSGVRVLDLDVTLSTSGSGSYDIVTGGVYAPTATTLSKQSTALTVRRTADLTVADPSVDDRPSEGVTHQVTSQVTNLGNRTLRDVPVDLRVNGTDVATRRVDLGGDNTTTVTFDWEPDTDGYRKLTVIADPNGTVPEETTANNSQFSVVEVQATGGGGGGGGFGGGGGDGEEPPTDTPTTSTPTSPTTLTPASTATDAPGDQTTTATTAASDTATSNATDEPAPESTAGSGPGFGVAGAVVAALAAAAFAARRRP